MLAALSAGDRGEQNGLCLYLGAMDARKISWLATNSTFQVQGVVSGRAQAERLRSDLQACEPGNRMSVVWRRTAHLPYLDSLVNLIVADGWGAADLQGLPLSEVARVLCPGGVAVVGSDATGDAAALLAEASRLSLVKVEKLPGAGAWIRITKQVSPAFGEWPSFAGGPEMNMVSPDTAVAVGREIRWFNGPMWTPMGGYRNEVIAGGRTFHEESEWEKPQAGRDGHGLTRWVLVARDACNGCELWREKFKASNASDPTTRMCADEKRVYHLEGGALVGRDAATGKICRDYGPGPASATSFGDCLLMNGNAVEKETGKVRWSRPGACCQPAAKDGTVYILDGANVEAVTLADGKSVWKTPIQGLSGRENLSILCKGDAVYALQRFRDKPTQKMRQTVIALERSSGTVRWTDVRDLADAFLPFADQIILPTKVKSEKPGINVLETVVLDARTGKQVKLSRTPSSQHIGTRCWAPRATDRFVIYEGRFYIDTRTLALTMREGVRSSCHVGQFVAYGLEYNTPHACNCEVALRGVAALSPGSAIPAGTVEPALIRGTAAASGPAAGPQDWPTYRADAARSDACGAELPAQLKPLWTARLGRSPLPQATGAGKLVFVTDPDAHRVYALELATGKPQWTFTAEGRVMIAPTYSMGLCLFGDQAGWVYCLDAASGRLAWQLQAAPEQRYMGACNQLESSWPVRSGVLVLGDKACFAAGRCGTMDGGMSVFVVDAASGQVQWKKSFTDIRPMDILRTDGKHIYFGTATLNPADGALVTGPAAMPAHTILLSSPDRGADIAILDGLASIDPSHLRERKKLLTNGKICGVQIAFDASRTITTWRRNGYGSSMPDKNVPPAEDSRCHVLCRGTPEWINKETAQQMQALILAGTHVYGAGIPDTGDPAEKPALCVLSAADGKTLQKIELDGVPSIDGLSAVGGQLLLATRDGRLICYGAK